MRLRPSPRTAAFLALATALGLAPACTGGGSSSERSSVFVSAPALVAPTNGTSGLEASPALRWEDPLPLNAGAAVFDLEIATDDTFQTIVESAVGLTGHSFRPAGLSAGTSYAWRVKARAQNGDSPWSDAKRFATAAQPVTAPERPVIYQLVVRHFGNTTGQNRTDGTIDENGCGTFADIDPTALERIADLGATHVWFTGVLQQATLTDWSAFGQAADDPDIVKGRAGSFYAIKDYYDVSPDYAVDKAKRMEEFEALIDRAHAKGLKVLIDFVPNHVARSYASDQRPAGEPALGGADDQTKFFARDNAFYYLQADPGRALELTAPLGWAPAGRDQAFAPESGAAGAVPKVTGNDDTSYTPADTAWYETIKLNYGLHFTDPAASDFGAPGDRPATWLRMRAILRFWIDKGVDGFRCDFAHLVPDEAWTFLIDDARAHAQTQSREVFFVAEAYARLSGLMAAGFDAVYDDATYDGTKAIYQGSGSVASLDAHLQGIGDAERAKWGRYLENHDERRLASPIVQSGNPDDSGFGSPDAGRKIAPLVYLAGNGPLLVYNGQEVGETGAGSEGFGGEDGRTTIFDYWRLPALSAWVNEGRFDGAQLSAEQRGLRAYYRRILTIANHPHARGSRFYGLGGANPGLTDAVAFCRFATDGGGVLVVVTNFALSELRVSLKVPTEVGDAGFALLPADVTITRILDAAGDDAPLSESTTRAALAAQGIPITLPAGSAAVFVIE